MSNVIYKYPLNIGNNTLEIPKGGGILCVKEQQDGLFLWVLVDPVAEVETRTLLIFGTGQPIPDFGDRITLSYVDTAMLDKGSFVGHIFEVLGKMVPKEEDEPVDWAAMRSSAEELKPIEN